MFSSVSSALIEAISTAKEVCAPLAGQDWIIVVYLCAVAVGVTVLARRWVR